MKFIIHKGHLEFKNCKKRARPSLFLSLMNSEIKDIAKKCLASSIFQIHQPGELIINHTVPNQDLTNIASDHFCLYEHYYSRMIYYYSKITVTKILKNVKSRCKSFKY